MKKAILLTVTACLLTNPAFAWEIGPWKGDDPQIVKDITEGAKHAATQVSNAGRDAIAAVGNATGISNIIEHNKQTISDMGSINACLATLCYSEVLKKKELEEAEQEAQAKYAAEVSNTQHYYDNLKKNDRINRLNIILEDSATLLKNLDKQLNFLNLEKQTNQTTLKALNTQITWNDAMAKQGLQERPSLAVTDMKAIVTSFEKKMNSDYESAINDLNNELAALEKSANRSRADLMSDLIYTLTDSTLKNFTAILETEKIKIDNEIIDVESRIVEIRAQQASANALYLQETQGSR
ncbi:MAG: hypothetical protein ACKOX6_02765 [Bdellovibrio sp.]